MSNIAPFLALAGAFALLFIIAEALYHILHIPAEITRKIVHAGTGCLTLLFPFLLHNEMEAGLLCGSFLLILFLSMRYRILPSIHAVNRKSWGSLLYPVVVFCIYVFYRWHVHPGIGLFYSPYYFFTPVLVMALCDPVAALAGSAWSSRHPQIPPGKTFAGSLAFFISATVLTACLSAYFNRGALPFLGFIVTGIMLAFIATLAERFSSRGWDNFTIPLVVASGMQVMEIGLKSFAG